MNSQPDKRPPSPPLAFVEANLFGTLLAFRKKTMTLVREASLDDDKLKVVSDRIKTLLDSATAEVKQTQQMNIKEKLEAAYDEVKRLVDELSGVLDGGKGG